MSTSQYHNYYKILLSLANILKGANIGVTVIKTVIITYFIFFSILDTEFRLRNYEMEFLKLVMIN